jgi:multidrug resistance efflux pump
VEGGVTALKPAVPGRVVSVAARENEQVRAGDVLVQLDDCAARLRVRQAEADVQAARERLRLAKALPRQHEYKIEEQQAAATAAHQRLKAQRALVARLREKLQKDLANAKDVEAAEAAAAALEAAETVEQAKLRELRLIDPRAEEEMVGAEVEAKQARLELARKAVEDCRVTAPKDGMAMRVLVSPGDTIGPQSQQPAVLFCPAGERIVRAEVEQEFADRVAEGQRAEVQDDSRAGRVWHGTMRSVSAWFARRREAVQEPGQFNDVRTLECIVSLDAGQPPLRIGQRVRVRIGGR